MDVRRVFIGYGDWREIAAKEAKRTNPTVTCPTCRGDGDKECGECGSDVACDTCNGAGELPFNHLNSTERGGVFDEVAYKKILLEDVQALADWIRADVIAMLVDLGYHPYTVIRSRELVLAH